MLYQGRKSKGGEEEEEEERVRKMMSLEVGCLALQRCSYVHQKKYTRFVSAQSGGQAPKNNRAHSLKMTSMNERFKKKRGGGCTMQQHNAV